MLWMCQRVMFGTITNEKNRHLLDMNAREVAYMLPILLFVFWIGIYPETFLRKMDGSVEALVMRIETKRQGGLEGAPPGGEALVMRMETKRQAALEGAPPGETLLARYFDIGN